MNIPEIYLVEPYNAYAPKGRKKHWHEIVEEQALMQRIMAEQMALQEAQSKTLPPNSPPISVQTAVGTPPAGAGGQPVWDYWAGGSEVVDFSATPLSGAGPLTVQFTNLTPTPQFDTYIWKFGDGTTSTDTNPVHVYQSGSLAGYTVQLTASHDVGAPITTSKSGYISASIPTVTAGFTYVTSSGAGPVTASFTNTTTNNSQTPTTTYKFEFGDGQSSSLATVSHAYANTGSFTASLQATGSYGIASKYTQSFFVPAPTLTIAFTIVSQSRYAPTPVTLSSSYSYNGHGTLSGLWGRGEYRENNTEYVVLYDPTSGAVINNNVYDTRSVTGQDGNFTASLQVTESIYGISTKYTKTFSLLLPTVTALISATTSSNSAPSTATFINASTCNTSSTDSVIYKWIYGSGSLTSSAQTAPALSYTVAGPYTASLEITESKYGTASKATYQWRLA